MKDKDAVIKKCIDMLNTSGIIYIQDPKPTPEGWKSDKFNIKSPMFDQVEWDKKVKALGIVKDYFLDTFNDRYDVTVKHYDWKYVDIYVIKPVCPYCPH